MKSIATLFAVVAAAVAACDRPADYVLPPYVVDSDLPAAYAFTFGEVVWMDDRRLLFQRREQVDGPEGPGTKRIHPITIWHTDTGKIVTYDPDPNGNVSGLCFSPATGNIRYLRSYDEYDDVDYMTGPFGREQAHNPKRNKMGYYSADGKISTVAYNHHDCTTFKKPPWTYTRVVYPLLPGDGHLDGGARREDSKDQVVLHYPEGSEQGQKTPFPKDVAYSDCMLFYPFKGAYFAASCFGNTGEKPDAVCGHAWWYWPKEERTEKVCVPTQKSYSAIAPTRLGLVVNRISYDREGNLGDSGLYLLKDDRKIQLIWGYVPILGVSTDGCKVGFQHTPENNRGDRPDRWKKITVKMIDLCANEQAILSTKEE
jgi:hypothetical protein